MMIPEGVIFIWTGTNAAIPAGWERETALDGVFPKATADGVDPNVTGGNATHTHTSPAHQHTMVNHTHSGNVPAPDTSGGWSKDSQGPGGNLCQNEHSHTYTTNSLSGGTLSDAITYQSVNSEPPHRKVIFIRPASIVAPMKVGIVGLWKEAELPQGYSLCNGVAGAPDLRDKYLKGAAGGGNSDVVSTFGSLNHTHDVSHTHSAVTHSHSGDSSTASGGSRQGSGGTECNTLSHHHTVTLSNYSHAGGAYSGSVVSGTVEPLYKKLAAIIATIPLAPKKIIGMWLGLLSNIPGGWILCNGANGTPDMRGYHLKIANDLTESEDTGGANTHVHAPSNSHGHAGTSHTHTITGVSQTAENTENSGTGGDMSIQANHVHNQTPGSVSTTDLAYNSATIEANSSNNEPPYRTIAFIQAITGGGGGALAAFL